MYYLQAISKYCICNLKYLYKIPGTFVYLYSTLLGPNIWRGFSTILNQPGWMSRTSSGGEGFDFAAALVTVTPFQAVHIQRCPVGLSLYSKVKSERHNKNK